MLKFNSKPQKIGTKVYKKLRRRDNRSIRKGKRKETEIAVSYNVTTSMNN